MASALTNAHIEGQRRLRLATVRRAEQIWRSLPGYDRRDVDGWLSQILPLISSSQRQSVALTEAFVARFLGRQPIGVIPDDLIGAAVRNGTDPATVYERPFVTLWSRLDDTLYEDALAAATARVTATAALDVQLAMRAAFEAIDQADPNIYGYQRVADGDACDFCAEIDGAYVKGNGYVMALHNNCGCSLEPLTEPHRGAVTLPDGTPIRRNQYGSLNDKVSIQDHGELGPVITDPAHTFTTV